LKQAQQIVDPNKTESAETKINVSYTQAFTLEQLHQSVVDYTKKMQEQGKKQIAVMLRPEVISLQNEIEIIVGIENKAQQDGFEPMKQDFLDHVRRALNNQTITMRMEEKAADPTKRAYSPSEKFETMLLKNPALLTLKNRLGMELDY
jgi:DNA polymerase-3 subunit gamma/tau